MVLAAAALSLLLGAATGRAQSLSGTFNSVTAALVTSGTGYAAAGNTVNLTLNFAPPVGAALTVIENTGTAVITGTFNNLAQGQVVTLTYKGVIYNFVANYFGGGGNDLVLEWAGTQAYAWGDNAFGQLGNSGTANSLLPIAVDSSTDSALNGQTITAISAGNGFSLALSSSGTVLAWGYNGSGQLGTGGTTGSLVPVSSSTTSALNGRTVIAISAGNDFGLALCSDGGVAAWGDNALGQLGDGGVANNLVPVAVDSSASSALNGKRAIAVSAGGAFSLALCSDGSVAAWGDNSAGQLGNGGTNNSLVPVAVDSSTDSALNGQTVIAVSAGVNHGLALSSTGAVLAWGDNSSGELGTGGTNNSATPVAVDSSTDSALNGQTITAISAGNGFSLALSSSGTVLSWGNNSSGQLGTGGTSNSLVTVAVDSSTDSALYQKTVVAIAAGNAFAMALCSDGSVVAWGDNTYGELGNSGTSGSLTPVFVASSNFPTGSQVIAVAGGPGANTGLALVAIASPPQIEVQQPAGTNLVSGSTTASFGSPMVGSSNQLTFTIVNAGMLELTNLAVAITGSGSSQFTAAALSTPTLGSGGTETFTVTFRPTLAGLQSATLQVTSNDPATPSFDLALSGTGTAFGSTTFTSGTYVPIIVNANNFNPTGIPLNLALGYAPAVGTNLTVVNNTALSFIVGAFSNLAQGQVVSLTYNGVTYYFVANYYGGKGNDLVLQWAGAQAVAWGDNTYGQLGDGGTNSSIEPVAVNSSSTSALYGQTIFALSAGRSHSLALCASGTVAAWGDNTFGALGTSGSAGSLTPVAVDSSTDSALSTKTVIAVSAGSDHSLALCSDGSVAAWGYGNDGELGYSGSGTANSLRPVAVDSSTDSALNSKTVVAISAGAFHNLALCSNGSVVAWGFNAYGQLGDDRTADSLVPVAVDSSSTSALFGKTVVAISAGASHSLALCSDGSVAAWGDNEYGELGNNSTINSTAPVAVDKTPDSALNGKTVVAISAGGLHSLALCSDGTVVAWGYNAIGQLGDSGTAGSLVPVAVDMSGVLAGRTVTAISGGVFDSLALCSDGGLAAWGWNFYGQLGDDDASHLFSNAPVAVESSNLAAGNLFSAAASGPAANHALALVAGPVTGQPLLYSVTPGAGANGTISPDTVQMVSSGNSASFTASSGTGYVVNQWLVSGSVVQTVGNTYTLENVTANAAVQVTFAPVATPFPGTYEGLFVGGGGYVSINLSARGRFTGKILISGSERFNIGGQFNSAGAWQGAASGKAVSLQLCGGQGGTPGSYFINGSFALTNNIPFTAWHTVYGAKFPVAEAGKYTHLLASAYSGAGIPQVAGSATLTVGRTGVVRFSGKLPDGESFNVPSVIVGGPSGDQCIIYSILNYSYVTTPGEHGFLTGSITFPAGVVTGPLSWFKPPQFKGPYRGQIETSLIIAPRE